MSILEKRPPEAEPALLLASWCDWAASRLGLSADGDALYFGNGHNHWGVQTNQKALAGFATAGTLDGREEWIDISRKMLRFSLQTHHTGDRRLLDGGKWGHCWYSALGIERMMHVAPDLDPYLTQSERDSLRKVLLSEADWLLESHPIRANKVAPNVPESNLWNGCLLYRIAQMYPVAKHANLYLEKSYEFIINGISLDSDALCEDLIAGRSIKEWHVDSQFHDSMALFHHEYLNVGYMYICLSHVAITHFACKQMGWPAPEPLYRHTERLWDVLALMTFPNGRLARIGGDTRVRYTYCQDYALVVWQLMQDLRRDAYCRELEKGWLPLMQKEIAYSGDGSFFGRRLSVLGEASWLYHSRLESDRAVSLSMALSWKPLIASRDMEDCRLKAEDSQTPKSSLSNLHSPITWSDAFHGSSLVRGKRRLASWTWRAALPNMGLCLPVEGSDLAEWHQNLAGEIIGKGARNYQEPICFDRVDLPAGFLTWGLSHHCSEFFCNEGDTNPLPLAEQFTAVAALPDDRTMLVMQRCHSLVTERVKSLKGLHFLIQNDLHNDSLRVYRNAKGSETTRGGDTGAALRREIPGNWINVDERVGLVLAWSSNPWVLNQPGRRQIGIKPYPHIDSRPAAGNLCADEICAPCSEGEVWLEQDAPLYDLGVAVLAAASSKETERVAASDLSHSKISDTLRALTCRGADGKRYALIANSDSEHATWQNTDPVAQTWGGASEGRSLTLAPQSAALVELA